MMPTSVPSSAQVTVYVLLHVT
jgi:hypothetical protein